MQPAIEPDAAPLISLKSVSKRFGPLWANKNISLDFSQGEIHALVGENGAGKSTLMKVLFGHFPPDGGGIFFKGKPVSFGRPRDAMHAGIGMVHQQLLMFPQLTALENIVVGAEPSSLGWMKRTHAGQKAAELCRSFGFDLPLDRTAGTLSFAHRQQIELLRVLYRGAKILILDEPTSLLAPQEVERLLLLLKSLRAQGRTVIFISHRLREVFQISDRISILQRGKCVGTFPADRITPEDVIARIVSGGKAAGTALQPNEESLHDTVPEGLSLADSSFVEIKNISVRSLKHEAGLKDFSLRLSRGEIVGLGGVVGNGQRILAKALAGAVPVDEGRISFRGEIITSLGVRKRAERGFRWLPANPSEEAFLPHRSLWENLLLGRQRLKAYNKAGWLLRNKVIPWAGEQLRAQEVVFQDMEEPVSALSGGNQQRMALARVLEGTAGFVILEQASRGLDIYAQRRLHGQIRSLSGRGVTFLIFSDDLDELLSVCHRVGILYRGRLMGMAQKGNVSREDLGKWMLGLDA